jgi:hypothetical protein
VKLLDPVVQSRDLERSQVVNAQPVLQLRLVEAELCHGATGLSSGEAEVRLPGAVIGVLRRRDVEDIAPQADVYLVVIFFIQPVEISQLLDSEIAKYNLIFGAFTRCFRFIVFMFLLGASTKYVFKYSLNSQYRYYS